MDPVTLLFLGLIGGAAYLFFNGAPLTQLTAATAPPAPLAPTSTMPATTAAPATSTTAAGSWGVTSPGTNIAARVSTGNAWSGASVPPVASPGTVMSTATPAPSAPAKKSVSIPSDLTFMMRELPQAETETWAQDPRVEAMLSSMRLIIGTNDNCQGFTPANPVTFAQLGMVGAQAGLGIAAVAGGTGSAAAGIATAAVPIIGAAAAIAMVVSAIFSHHAAAVKKQAQYDCAAVAAVNNTLDQIDEAIASGQFTASQAQQAWEQLYTNFVQFEQPVMNEGAGSCNAPCGFKHILRAIVDKYECMYGVGTC